MEWYWWVLIALAFLCCLASGSPERGKNPAGAKTQETTWILHGHVLSRDEYECSRCHGRFREKSNFCPRCGARNVRVRDTHEWIDELAIMEIIDED